MFFFFKKKMAESMLRLELTENKSEGTWHVKTYWGNQCLSHDWTRTADKLPELLKIVERTINFLREKQ